MNCSGPYLNFSKCDIPAPARVLLASTRTHQRQGRIGGEASPHATPQRWRHHAGRSTRDASALPSRATLAEFLERERETIRAGTKLIFPLPAVEIVSNENYETAARASASAQADVQGLLFGEVLPTR
jgi:hypothetical protein